MGCCVHWEVIDKSFGHLVVLRRTGKKKVDHVVQQLGHVRLYVAQQLGHVRLL